MRPVLFLSDCRPPDPVRPPDLSQPTPTYAHGRPAPC
eukprot:gene1334-11715_t